MDTNIRKKIAMVMVCTNERYWPYIGPMINSARTHFLANHDVTYLLWTDMPKEVTYGATIFETEDAGWPYPTLMRYHLFLQQEEELKKYDYIFYADADMIFVDTVGDEILGTGITATQHPMYALRREYQYPFELNPLSSAYLKVPSTYFAGGFQGGVTSEFLKAMRLIKDAIDYDFDNNYIARWNDESHWNKYLYENPPSVVLNPSYCYPDSLIKEYYVKVWGRDYPPKLITITKPHTVSKQGGEMISDFIKSI